MPDLNKAYQWAINTCNAPNVGYSQPWRNQETHNGITYYDCSSFINYALIAGGWVTPQYAPRWPFVTGDMYTVLPALGFVSVPASGQILPGDIGLSPSHTEMCYSGGIGRAVFMGAHIDTVPLKNQVSIGNSSGDATATRSFPNIYRYGSGGATGYGISLPVIAALCGNAWKESQINPGLEEVGGGGGYGLFQWTDTPGSPRRTNFENWCIQNGFAFNDPNGQVQYLIVEDDWIQVPPYPFASLTEFLNSDSTDIEMLTRAWEDCWERSADSEAQIQQRIAWANECFTYISVHAQDTNIFEWYVSNHYITDEQTLNNAVMLYRILSVGGGGGTQGIEKKMPIWMKIRYHY